MTIEAQNETLIRHYLDLAQYEKALPLVRESLANNPLQGKWHYEWARIHYLLNRYEEVESYLQEALRLGYSPLETYFLLGKYYMSVERYGRAQGAFEAALNSQPQNAVVMAAFSHLKWLMGKKKEAKRMIEEAMRLSPGNPLVLNYFVDLQLQQRSKRKRMQAMELRIQSGGSEKTRFIVMGLYESQRSRYRAAREHYRQAFLLDPLDRNVLNGLYRTNLLCHPLLLPWRWMARTGGRRVSLLVNFVLCVLLGMLATQLHWDWLAGTFMELYFIYILYLVIASRVIRWLIAKNQKKNRESVHLHG